MLPPWTTPVDGSRKIQTAQAGMGTSGEGTAAFCAYHVRLPMVPRFATYSLTSHSVVSIVTQPPAPFLQRMMNRFPS